MTETESEKELAQLEKERKERLARQLAQRVCICKGISLGKVLQGLEGCETVEEVNRKTGCGTGGCEGQRCGPKIRALLHQKKKQSGDKSS